MLQPYQDIIDGRLDYSGTQASLLPDPIGIGAVGGSGTRLLQQMMVEAGVAMASPLNKAGDAFEWPPWQKLLSEDMLSRHARESLIPNILHAFEQLLVARRESLELSGRAGWKVPGTFHWLAEMGAFFPGYQYLHLVRHGLDMAYSGNQNQIKNWAPSLGVEIRLDDAGKVHPHSMLEYWLTANEVAHQRADQHMPGRMRVVRFEDLCSNPQNELRGLLEFLQLEADIDKLASLVAEPGSVGRYREEPWEQDFTEEQLRRLEALGYTP